MTERRPIDRLVAAMAQRDADGFAACLHSDVEWCPLSMVFGSEGGAAVLRGREAVRGWLADTQGVGYNVSAAVLEPCDADHAVVSLSVGRGQAGAGARATVYGVFSYADGLVRSGRPYPTREAAAAAILSARASTATAVGPPA